MTHRLLLAGILAKNNKNKAEVIQLVDTVIDIIPENPKPVRLKATYLVALKDYKKAAEVANYAVKRFPENSLGYKLKGDIARLESKNSQAIEYYWSAYKFEPDNNALLFLIVDLLSRESKVKEAIRTLENFESKNKNNAAYHIKLAGLYEKNKQYRKAIFHYNKTLNINPENIVALNNLAWNSFLENEPEAINFSEKAYYLKPDSAPVIDTYAYILVKQGNMEKGIDLLKKAAEIAPNSNAIRLHLAEAYILNNEYQLAKQILTLLLNQKLSTTDKQKALDFMHQIN